MKAYDTEILKIIKQLHKSRRKIWRINDAGKIEQHNQRQHMTSRRDQVWNSLFETKCIQLIYFFIYFSIEDVTTWAWSATHDIY